MHVAARYHLAAQDVLAAITDGVTVRDVPRHAGDVFAPTDTTTKTARRTRATTTDRTIINARGPSAGPLGS
ncbi:hypothetical protein K439DRAFT_1642225 [Ramaria rubella]|nr:hypothetical protein K439DRAFT_1642225 [Ramaria rubella]